MYIIKFKDRQEVSDWLKDNPSSKAILTKYLEKNLLIDISNKENIIDCLENLDLSTLGTFYHFATGIPISTVLRYNSLKSTLLQSVDLRIENRTINFRKRLMLYNKKCIECKNYHIC